MADALLAHFQDEFEAARLAWLRRRFLLYTGLIGGVSLAVLPLAFYHYATTGRVLAVVAAVTLVIQLVIFGAAFLAALRRAPRLSTRDGLVSAAGRLMIASLILQFIPAAPLATALTALLREVGVLDPTGQIGVLYPVLGQSLLIHLTAAVLLPLTPRETLRPLVPFLLLYTTASLLAPLVFRNDSPSIVIVALPMIALVGVPGLLVSWIKASRFVTSFTNQAVRERFAELAGELSTARRIHDRLFPLPVREGPLRVEFAYEPMRQIGGDILYARKLRPADAASPIDLIVIDVTGHGIAAALAVNRLHAELNRLYGLHAANAPSPGRIVDDLNDYVSLTMADEGFFATAICVRVDPVAETVVFANAGHPPAFLFRADGTIERLDSTTFMLGAGSALGEDFVSVEASAPFKPGDRLLAYSDGATEARSAEGRMLGIDELERVSRKAASPEQVVDVVRAFRGGPPQDDTLVVAVWLQPV